MVKNKTITSFFKRTNEEQQVEGIDDEIQESKRQKGSTSEPVIGPAACNEQPSEIPQANINEVDVSSLERDPAKRLEMWKYPVTVREQVRLAYISLGVYQPKLEEYKPRGPKNNLRRFKFSWFGIYMSLIIKKKIGNGNHTRFWMDNWVGGGPLKLLFPRLYRLDTNQQCVGSHRAPTFHQHYATTSAPIATDSSQIGPFASHVGLVYNWSWLRPIRSEPDLAELEDLCILVAHLRLSDNQDKWECIIDNSRTSTVKGMLSQITHLSTNTSLIPIRWNSILPSKANILTWRIANMRLPTWINLDYRDIDLDSI
ncbi:RNA-directed DNA polymerase, eukaryota, Reverse transcriptase zinc-binding domain protein [Artemisia annua]|uniref:RNA-directed DNA polymerase, eukaryota, Reverse transcriptase zinc-binding domain protein n=1 Tax=Artemisia annua TaxID=35608 RepID=A0A2U1L6C0_ARTAN|nr:RNA-directed DNA polymerase, eukaryota, Reverse transcriptase zinc-binding domain protein [Artemisia annua]